MSFVQVATAVTRISPHPRYVNPLINGLSLPRYIHPAPNIPGKVGDNCALTSLLKLYRIMQGGSKLEATSHSAPRLTILCRPAEKIE